jgi:hypothetical protein
MNKYTNIIQNLLQQSSLSEMRLRHGPDIRGLPKKAQRKADYALGAKFEGKPNNYEAARERLRKKDASQIERRAKRDAAESVLTFGQLLDELTEMKKTVASWQSGVRSSQLSGIPSSKQFKDPDFAAGYGAGMEKGTRAMDPSYRARRVAKKANQIAANRGEENN